MRLLVCAGGTGGGVYPALAILQALGNEAENVLWVGSEGGMERDLVLRAQIPFEAIPAAGVHGVGWRQLPRNILRLIRGTLAARRILRAYQPDVLLFTGGYVGVPMAIAGRSIPSLVFVPDIEPGLALNLMSRFAHTIAVTTPRSRHYFPAAKNVVVTGYPIRTELIGWQRNQARQRFGLDEEKPVLLVMGGSKGARSINRAVLTHLEALLNLAQVIHITGQTDWPEVQQQIAHVPINLQHRYHAFPYLHEDIGAAFAAADLILCRAGASTLGELPFFGLPAILVPYPYAWRYQAINAAYLTENRAAVTLDDAKLSETLLPTLQDLFSHPQRLQQMATAMRALATPDAATKLADLIRTLAAQSPAPRKHKEVQ
ncbi:undecaprenyldiphospho-muramoylpentapeptide beta-N-acetylglucosaminyltransferase [Thermanaerothrix sp. 4228-RoL]|uniref:UDP-N-acetylglucosamine--N-acetylmuramyl-(pentapeptide) pyrophosphoryl-undecaprenol N-acetylglucosamine transferase n=1 Tax=Thermanaerothrix solaris TaxID=3058434 RepID=A0ABU3NR72_9CHLR|nr:undecaprenyldiphospho-muramoylpentapeptide beta-N-acetylglucosaminyltransferase [Thermanaerothrix sp. 4228-RoL]MDT8899338.1 undecaprenyldiphospho-muramoylpentapeptide beta-N-acetylglucosaminyltransferase [Thermanaerothrix sp. 4228-RoL]